MKGTCDFGKICCSNCILEENGPGRVINVAQGKFGWGSYSKASPKLVEKVWVLFWGSKNSRKCAISLQARLKASNGLYNLCSSYAVHINL